jgi:hypothetical protein
MSTDRQPLILPDDFDPEVNLPGRDENGEVFHATIPGMNLAVELMRNGTPRTNIDSIGCAAGDGCECYR